MFVLRCLCVFVLFDCEQYSVVFLTTSMFLLLRLAPTLSTSRLMIMALHDNARSSSGAPFTNMV